MLRLKDILGVSLLITLVGVMFGLLVFASVLRSSKSNQETQNESTHSEARSD